MSRPGSAAEPSAPQPGPAGLPAPRRWPAVDLPPRLRWHGPASLVGALAGIVLWSLPFVGVVARDQLWPWAVPPLLGLLLLPFRGPVRRVGVGLLASCVCLPAGVLAAGLAGFTV